MSEKEEKQKGPTTLLLVGRHEDSYGRPQWHDALILQNALESICKGKNISELGRWLKVASRLQKMIERQKLGQAVEVEKPAKMEIPDLRNQVTLELHGTEGDLLWDEIKKLSPDKFNHGKDIPIGPLGAMLESIAESLGKNLD